MLFKYKATTSAGEIKVGTIDAASSEIAISALQRKNLIIISLGVIKENKELFSDVFSLFRAVKIKDVVLFSRQLSTLFEAKVPILPAFRLLADETENPVLKNILIEVTNDLQGGASLSQALSKHPDAFSKFFVSMVRAGEESGKLEEVFSYMAFYLERSYDLTSKAKRALIYPAFVVVAFFGVIILMMVMVIPKLKEIIMESNQEVPLYTKIILNMSDILKTYGIFFLVLLVFVIFLLWRYSRTVSGRGAIARLQIQMPIFGDFYKKLYLSRMADNLQTLISGGVSMVRSLEISADVVGNEIYRMILLDTLEGVKAGSALSESLSKYEEVPGLVSQMVKIGEESGKLDFILKTLASYYTKEVNASLETIVSLIEPMLMVVLGAGVGLLLASVLIPIYNIAQSI